jgi:CubicO group peptidase (beta-lactamase class C family)
VRDSRSESQPWDGSALAFEAAVRAAGITGASLAYWDGRELRAVVAGVRNSVTGDPLTADTVMHIGSITKVLNAALVMQLVDDGLIRLEDLVSLHLPELRLGDMSALGEITCEMLLNHTSGIMGDALPDYGPDQERILDAIARCADLPQLHHPGGGPSYCNIGTVIAGYLVQRLRGRSWYTLIKSCIFDPLQMDHSLADLTDLPRFRCSVGDLTTVPTGMARQTSRPFLPLSSAPAGATLMMTATDLVTFARALLGGGVGSTGRRILSSASATRMTLPTARFLSPACEVGLGWMILPHGVLHHGGGGPGIASCLYAHPASGRTVALLTNSDRHDALKADVIDPILESWTGTREKPAKHCTGPMDINKYVGVYESDWIRADVAARTGGLTLKVNPNNYRYDNAPEGGYPEVPLHYLGCDTFAGSGMQPGLPNIEFRFVNPDEDGRMQVLGCLSRLLPRSRGSRRMSK